MERLGKIGLRSRPRLRESLLYEEKVPYGARHCEVHGTQLVDERAELGDRELPLARRNGQKIIQLL